MDFLYRFSSLRMLLNAVAVLAIASHAKAASDPTLEFDYEQAPQTILNRDGGPWNHLDLMTLTVDQLKNHVNNYTVNGAPYSIGPLRLIHAFICLNPVGIDFNQCSETNDNPKPLSPRDLTLIDAALNKALQARVKVILRFAYNHGQGDDAPLEVILRDIHRLAPIVKKYKSIIYAMNTGFIGFWGEGHDSTKGNNTQDAMRQILQAEQSALGNTTFMLNRQPANILSWEIGPFPYWGIHDDHYATFDDGGTWKTHPWDNGTWDSDFLKAFASQRSDVLPFSGEIGGSDPQLQSCGENGFDDYSKFLHLNMMNIGFNTNLLVSQGCFPDVVNKIGPAISLTHASLDSHFAPGTSSKLTLTFRNTGYSRLFSPKPMYFVLIDAEGNQLPSSIFPPIPIPFDLRQLNAIDGEGSVDVNIPVPISLLFNQQYQAALWIPDADPVLATMHEYNYLLNNRDVPNDQTGFNVLFPLN